MLFSIFILFILLIFPYTYTIEALLIIRHWCKWLCLLITAIYLLQTRLQLTYLDSGVPFGVKNCLTKTSLFSSSRLRSFIIPFTLNTTLGAKQIPIFQILEFGKIFYEHQKRNFLGTCISQVFVVEYFTYGYKKVLKL